jgi:penicillin-binding protein 2
MRIRILRVTIFGLFVILALNLIYVQVVRGKYYHGLSVNNRIRVIPLEGQRGRILDRNGAVLADNRLSFDVTVIPQDIKEEEGIFEYLSQTLQVDEKKLLQNFHQKKITPFAPVIIAEDVNKRIAMILEENKFRFSGLYIQETFVRRYPLKKKGAHALGYVGKINRSKIKKLKDYGYSTRSVVGYSGVEEKYDMYLRAEEGGRQIEVNSRGRQVRLLSQKDPQKGKDIKLTLDLRVQRAAFEALGENHGSIIVMDLDTGELLGMVSSPSFDPNLFVSRKTRQKTGKFFMDRDAPMLDRSIKGQYPPGSVFKIILSIAALETKNVEPNTEFFCKGAYELGWRRFRCAHVHGAQDLVAGIAHSCNVYFYNIGLLLGPDLIHKYARLFGLGELTNVDLPYEDTGSIPNRIKRRMQQNRGWFKGDTLNFSIGQGDVLVTPIQLVRMMATVAQSGKEIQPHLIKSIDDKDIIQLSTGRNIRIKKEIFDVVRKGMRSAVTDEQGTANILDMKDFTISGKTGTAQTIRGKRDHAWFVGYNTSGKRRMAFSIFLEYGVSSHYACNTAKKLLKWMEKEGAI